MWAPHRKRQLLRLGPRPPHPGIRLLKNLEEYRVTREQLAALIGLEVPRINALINGSVRCTFDLCILLAHAFGEQPALWADDQMQLDLWKARKKYGKPNFKTLKRRWDTKTVKDMCICGHWEWDHLDACTQEKDGKHCPCVLYINLHGYLLTRKATNGLPPEIRNEALAAAKRFTEEVLRAGADDDGPK